MHYRLLCKVNQKITPSRKQLYRHKVVHKMWILITNHYIHVHVLSPIKISIAPTMEKATDYIAMRLAQSK